MHIKPVYITKYTSAVGRTHTSKRNLFEKYEVAAIEKTHDGYTLIVIRGSRKTFTLVSCVHPLTIVSPPEKKDDPVTKREVPLYFVSPTRGAKSINGATYFAEIDGELVAYKSSGRYSIQPL